MDTTQQAIRSAITQQQLQPLPRRQRLARQRQRAAQQRATDRAAILGFEDMRAYLLDRPVTKAWTLRQVEDELGVAPATLRHLLDHHQVRRVAPTGWQRAAATAAAGPATQAQAVQQRRQARLAELGFAELGDYLRDRYVGRGWPPVEAEADEGGPRIGARRGRQVLMAPISLLEHGHSQCNSPCGF